MRDKGSTWTSKKGGHNWTHQGGSDNETQVKHLKTQGRTETST